MTTKRLLPALATLALAAGGCGGGDDGFDAPAGQGDDSGAAAGTEQKREGDATPDGR